MSDIEYSVIKSDVIKSFDCNSFLAGGTFGRLPITFANSLDPDQDSPALDPNHLTL